MRCEEVIGSTQHEDKPITYDNRCKLPAPRFVWHVELWRYRPQTPTSNHERTPSHVRRVAKDNRLVYVLLRGAFASKRGQVRRGRARARMLQTQ